MRNRVKSATPAMRSFIDDKAEDTQLPKEQEVPPTQTEDDVPPVGSENQQPDPTQEDDDDSWLDGLTPYQTEQQAPQQQQVQQPVQTAQPQEQPDDGTEEQKRRLAELYAGLEHIDEEVAVELHDKLITPELKQVRAELNELKQYRQQEQQARQTAVITDINTKIIAKYPKAEQILRSKEFMDYVNSGNNPYATDMEFNTLMRAYYAGDANYVIGKIDGFVSSRGKPKPPVGAEPQQGGGRSGVADTPTQKKPMTDAEYLAKRRAIKAAPKGTYPPNALKDLVNEYMNSKG